MDLKKFAQGLKSGDIQIPIIKEGWKVIAKVLKPIENGVLVECNGGDFVGVILSKEVKELNKNDFELSKEREIEVEIINPNIRHEDGYYIVSVTRLLQYDVWKNVLDRFEKDEVFTVLPTEANLGGLLINMHGVKGFIPLSQLAPIHYPRVEDGDQEAIFEKLLELIGQEIKVRIINIDEDERRIILSEREALKEDKDKILDNLEIGKVFEGIISGLSSYGLFVTIGGTVEGLVHISEITYGHVNDINRLGKLGDKVKVKVIGLENGKISLSIKKLKQDPREALAQNYKIGDYIEGEVIRFVPYGIFVRVFDDINGLVHLSELSEKVIRTPNEVVKLGQIINTKIILLDLHKKKIGLSMRDKPKTNKKTSSPSQSTSSKGLEDVVKNLEMEEDE